MYLDKLIAWCRDNNVSLEIKYDSSLRQHFTFRFVKFFVDGRRLNYEITIHENEIFNITQNEFLIEELIKEVSYKFRFIMGYMELKEV